MILQGPRRRGARRSVLQQLLPFLRGFTLFWWSIGFLGLVLELRPERRILQR
jgi:hypothetical protein